MPHPITRSTETCDGRLNVAGDVRHRFEHRLRAARVDHHVERDRDRDSALEVLQFALERDGDARRVRRRCRPRWRARAGCRATRTSRGRTAPRRCARRRTASSSCRARCSASPSVANGARPTPPATIHASAGGSTGSNGRPSGPRHETCRPRPRRTACVVVTPMRLLSSVRPSTRPFRPQDLEHRERPAQQRIAAAAGLHHHELSGLGGGGDLGSGERDDVVIGGEARVADDACLDVDGAFEIRSILMLVSSLTAVLRGRKEVTHA